MQEKPRYFTPGPSHLYPSLHRHILDAVERGVCSISHRSESFKKIYAQTVASLRTLLNLPPAYHVLFLGSATECMERLIQGTVAKKSYHFVNGAFSKRFFETSKELGNNALRHEISAGNGFGVLAPGLSSDIELICVTQNETATGVATSPRFIQHLREQNPHTLIAVDIVSAVPCMDIDLAGVDAAFFSVQKCFGLPSGLGVLLASDRVIERAKELRNSGCSIGSYHALPEFAAKADAHQTPETPNVLGIYLLGKIGDEMLSQGIETIRSETNKKAMLLYNTLEQTPGLAPFVHDPHDRSTTVIVAEVDGGSRTCIKHLEAQGLVLGYGYGEYKEKHLRIGNFPAHSLQDIQHLCALLKKEVSV
ncbi:aminotransferase class V-fold PLP-dependent enzyme [Candidatus Woesearchaeota archaeon]|nr:aminotransferase class V-fold PLP-dependent enzyme [Candidatus Woesearchaeota archaeon]